MRAHKEKIAASFGAEAHQYNEKADLQRRIAARLMEFLPETKPLRILEIGCGTGFLTAHLIEKHPQAKILATDIAPEMVAYCQEKFSQYSNIEYMTADAEAWDFQKKFDLIVSSMTLQWFSDPLQALQKLKDCLNPGGHMLHAALGGNTFPEWKDAAHEMGLPHGIVQAPVWPDVTAEDYWTEHYKSGLEFLRFMKKTGSAQPAENYQKISAENLKKILSHYDDAQKGAITWHIVYMHSRQ